MISGEERDLNVDDYVTVSRAQMKELQEAAEDRWYWKGRAHGLEYGIDALQTVIELISKARE